MLRVLRCAKHTLQRPKKGKSFGAITKRRLFSRNSAILSIRWKFQFLKGWGWSPKEVAIFVQRPQHKSTSDPVGAPKNNPFGAIYVEFGDTKKCCSFSGLELVPKTREKAHWRSQLYAQRSKMHTNPLGPSEKNSFC